ncbi:MAG: hypothetical protein ACYC1Z_01255 [Georgenia sp.]
MVLTGYLARNSGHTVEHDISVVGIGVPLGVSAMRYSARAIHRRRARAGDHTSPAGPVTVGDADGDDASGSMAEAVPSTLVSDHASRPARAMPAAEPGARVSKRGLGNLGIAVRGTAHDGYVGAVPGQPVDLG